MGRLERKAYLTKREKKLLALGRQADNFWKKSKEIQVYYDSDEEIFIGYFRSFRLKEHVKKMKQAEMFEHILKLVNVIQFSPDKYFKEARRVRQFAGIRIGLPFHFSFYNRNNKVFAIRDISEKEYGELSEEEKSYFVPVINKVKRFYSFEEEEILEYKFKYSKSFFETYVEARIRTLRYYTDEYRRLLKSKAYADNILERNCFRPILDRLYGYKNRNKEELSKEKKVLLKKLFEKEIEEAFEK